MPLIALSQHERRPTTTYLVSDSEENFKSVKFLRSLRMAEVQDQLEIKFRLTDGSDIGPKSFPAATSVATLKESVLTQWPKG